MKVKSSTRSDSGFRTFKSGSTTVRYPIPSSVSGIPAKPKREQQIGTAGTSRPRMAVKVPRDTRTLAQRRGTQTAQKALSSDAKRSARPSRPVRAKKSRGAAKGYQQIFRPDAKLDVSQIRDLRNGQPYQPVSGTLRGFIRPRLKTTAELMREGLLR
jgi:hypothetical protein